MSSHASSSALPSLHTHGAKLFYGLVGRSPAWALGQLLASHTGVALVVCPSEDDVEGWAQDLQFFLSRDVVIFPAKTSLLRPNTYDEAHVVSQRLAVLDRLLQTASAPTQELVVICSLEALASHLPAPDVLEAYAVHVTVGQTLSRDELLTRLSAAGYTPEERVEEVGEYAVRGGIVDVFAPNYPFPLRLEFMGDELESLRSFDPDTQASTSNVASARIIPCHDVLWTHADLADLQKRLKAFCDDRGIPPARRLELSEKITLGQRDARLDGLAPLFWTQSTCLTDYLPAQAHIFRLDPISWPRNVKKLQEAVELTNDPLDLACPPKDHFTNPLDVLSSLTSFALSDLSDIHLDDTNSEKIAFNVSTHTSLKHDFISARRSENPLEPLLHSLNRWSQNHYDVTLVVYTESSHKRLMSMLQAHGHHPKVILGHLSEGFEVSSHSVVYLTESEIFGSKKATISRRPDTEASPSLALGDLNPGDFIVHVDFGVGQFLGLKRMTIAGVENDFIEITYAGSDKLFLPVYRLHRIHKYVGADGSSPHMDRLGNSSSWQASKAKAQRAVEEMAQELINLYASRMVAKKKPFKPADETYLAFEGEFPFEETRDQLRTLEDVAADLESDKPMDRLICGDVGFGKTEIALRAAMRAFLEGKQTAVLVPTTVLCQQHYETFKKRFAPYPVRVEFLSRFKDSKGQKEVVEGLKSGKVDIVVGTHRLLSKDVSFANLGLLVLDEEHRFGVKHKEAIKQFRTLVNVLTLTATPIPRTLQLSMAGIRDLSIINTPPLNRRAVHTILCKNDDTLVREAIRKELSRGGQVFFLHNRVETISAMAEHLQSLVPEARIGIGHGQMPERQLESVMLDFLEKKTQILLCTTIIESGLDIPDANTILINRADCFGLAQLYQLRGRVGRSDQEAYCYLLIPGEDIIGSDALKRLKVLKQFTELGSGLRIAMHDLEIRGAGNLLGSSQSGHIANVGFELYSQLLEREVRKLKGQEVKEEIDPEIQSTLPAFIPEPYIPHAQERLLMYRRLSAIRTDAELAALKDEMRDRFGRLPPTVENLCEVLEMKVLAIRLGVRTLRLNADSPSITFSDQSPIDIDKLLQLMKRDKRIQLRPDQGLVLNFSSETDVFEETKKILLELCSSAVTLAA